MSQVAAEMLASIAHQHRRRGAPHHVALAEICERMADRMQGLPARQAEKEDPASRPIEHQCSVRTERLSTPCDDREAAIMSALERSHGKLSAAELGALIRVDVRRARAIVAHLCADHEMPICSTAADGFWLPQTFEEVDATCASLESRRIELGRRVAGIRAGAARRLGTGLLPGIGDKNG